MNNQVTKITPRVRHFIDHGVTIAYQTHDNGTVDMAYALTHENDQYNRRIGRNIALGRLQTPKMIPQRATITLVDASLAEDGRALENELLTAVQQWNF